MKRFSSLAQAIDFYLESRHRWGFALQAEGRTLRSLGRYAEPIHHRGPLIARLVLEWASEPAAASPLWGLLACRGRRVG